MIYKDQSETGTESDKSQTNDDSSSTISYTLENSDNESADLGGHVTVLEQEQQTPTLEDNDSSNNSTIPPTPKFTFREPTDQAQHNVAGISSSQNITPQSRTHFFFCCSSYSGSVFSSVSDYFTYSISIIILPDTDSSEKGY